MKRCLITLHLSLNDLLRRSVDLMRSAYTNHYQTRTIRRNRNSNKIVLSGSCVFRATYIIVFLTELVEQETKLTVKTKTKVATAFERTVALSLNLWRHVYCDVIDEWPFTQSLLIGRWHSRGGLKSLRISSLDMEGLKSLPVFVLVECKWPPAHALFTSSITLTLNLYMDPLLSHWA
jgi:hypothetical protein